MFTGLIKRACVAGLLFFCLGVAVVSAGEIIVCNPDPSKESKSYMGYATPDTVMLCAVAGGKSAKATLARLSASGWELDAIVEGRVFRANDKVSTRLPTYYLSREKVPQNVKQGSR